MEKIRFHHLYQTLQKTAFNYANKTAFVCDGHQYSYHSFLMSVDLASTILREHFQLTKGDIIVLVLGNRPEFCTLFYAAMSQGIIVVPLSSKLQNENIQIASTAKRLFIHRNTLNYRLKQIKKITGLDPFCFHDLMQLNTALYYYQTAPN